MTQPGDHTRGSGLILAFLLFVGLAVRVVVLPVDVTSRVDVWKIWSHNAVTEGVAALYGEDERTDGRRMLEFEGRHAPLSSPPGVLYGLELAGRLYRHYDAAFTDGPRLTAAVKLPILLAEILLAALIYVAVRRIMDTGTARWSLLAFWLNPAVILSGAVLGYFAPLFMLPALGALVFASWGYPAIAGVLFVAAMLTHLQAILLLPVLALALSRRAPLRTEAYTWATGAGVPTAIGILTPMATAGSLPSAFRLFASTVPFDTARDRVTALWHALPAGLRGVETAANAASSEVAEGGAEFSFVSTALQRIIDNPGQVIVPTIVVVGLWALWRGRALRFLPGWAGLAALLVHLASLADVAGSPNTLLLAVALLTVASAESVRYRPLVVALSLILAVSLLGYSGIDIAGVGLSNQSVGPTVVMSASALVLLWHAWVFNRECAFETPRLEMRSLEARRALAAHD